MSTMLRLTSSHVWYAQTVKASRVKKARMGDRTMATRTLHLTVHQVVACLVFGCVAGQAVDLTLQDLAGVVASCDDVSIAHAGTPTTVA